jgi:release factor glutamine methyltransferase
VTALTLAPGSTVADARRTLTRAFRAKDIDTPELDARILVGHALGLDRTATATADQRALSAEEAAIVVSLARRRLAGEPVARIRGHKEFWSLDFAVTPDVLVPRPETETLVETVLHHTEAQRRREALRIVDLGTGSGALLVALLTEFPHATGIATDKSFAALDVARENACAHDVANRAVFVACDYGSALRGGYDIIVTNPPYIETAAIDHLASEVRNHDPKLALDGGQDGLDAYRSIAQDAPRLLRSGGLIVAECGLGQAAAVAMLFVKAGLSVPHPAKADLSGIPRALAAFRVS